MSFQLDSGGVEAYYTNTEKLIDLFKARVATPELAKRILVIHGVGGVGKTSLLWMFRLHCKSVRVPVALASGDKAKSAVDVLTDWAGGLKANGVVLTTFAKTIKHYHTLQAKVDERTDKVQDAHSNAFETLGKLITKTTEVMAGATIGAAAGSVVPGIGTLVGALGGAVVGTSAEAMVDWLGGFLAKPDVDLLLNPTKKLTDDFLGDIAHITPTRRSVLMLDAFEQVSALNDWMCDTARRLPPNVLLVIAGRKMVNWDCRWAGWLSQADVYPLEPMSSDVIRELVRRYFYYATMLDSEPNPAQVESIIRFARGLPIAVTSAVRLWVNYGMQDFEGVRVEVIHDVVNRVRQGVPPEMFSVLEAAATVRWFDKPILRAVTGLADVNAVYDELSCFPFVKPGKGGLSLHDSVREIIDESLRVNDRERYYKLHERAAAYFGAQIAETLGEGRETTNNRNLRGYIIEALYHHLHADEKIGMQLVRTTFGVFLRQYDLALCDELVAMIMSLLEASEETKLWAEFLTLQITQQRSTWEDAFDGLESLLSRNLPLEMEIEARFSLGYALDYRGDRGPAIKEFSSALRLSRTIPIPLQDWTIQAKILVRLGMCQSSLVGFDRARQSLNEALDLARKVGNQRLIIDTLNEINYLMQRYDHFEDAEPILKEIIRLSEGISDKREVGLAHARLGEYLVNRADFSDESREHLEKAAYLLHKAEDIQSWAWANRNLGLLLVGRNEPQTALHFLEESVGGYRKRGASRGLFRSLVALCECLVEMSDSKRIRDLETEMEELDKRTALGDWGARWKAIQGDCEVSDSSGGEGALLQARAKYLEALQMAMDYNQCSLLYHVADRIANRVKWLTKNGRSRDAMFIVNGLVEAWASDSRSNGDAFLQVEKRRCAPRENSSVLARIKSGLG